MTTQEREEAKIHLKKLSPMIWKEIDLENAITALEESTQGEVLQAKKTLGQIAYESYKHCPLPWFRLEPSQQESWEAVATAIEREVIQYMRR